MGQFRKILMVVMLAVMSCMMCRAVVSYKALSAKASRFVQFQEWGSALAMYELMMDRQAKDAFPYSHAITLSGILGDEKAQVSFFERTQQMGIPLDSIFSQVKEFSFEIGESDVYKCFLELVKTQQPWIARNIDIQLLQYYVFRNNGAEMVRQGERLLETTPDNLSYLEIVAQGYVLQGLYNEAVKMYERMLEIDRNNYNAMLALGNYYYLDNVKNYSPATLFKAKTYLERAYALIPTPQVSKMMDKLREQAAEQHK